MDLTHNQINLRHAEIRVETASYGIRGITSCKVKSEAPLIETSSAVACSSWTFPSTALLRAISIASFARETPTPSPERIWKKLRLQMERVGCCANLCQTTLFLRAS
jgi:hypothetical protein